MICRCCGDWHRSAREACRDGILGAFLGVILALMLVVSGAVQAEPVFSFDATPGKLPKTVVPIDYSIELRPDAESLALPGVEVIERGGIFCIIAHEMAHQWIGDHVIMAWWDNLWLNEGSATSAATKSAEQFAMSLEALPCTGIPDSHGNPEFPT